MALTTAQTQALWRKQNNLRKFSFRIWQKKWLEYYLKQGRVLLNNLTEPGVIFPQEEVEALFVQMYQDVGTKFSLEGFENTKSSALPIQTKDLTFNEGFLLTWNDIMKQYALTEGAESIISIAHTAREQAIKIINNTTAEALEEGLSVFETEQLLENRVWDSWKITSKFNAERIARTEIIAASNYGAFTGAQSTGLKLTKVWLTVMDGRERETHAAANGQAVPINEPFNVGGSKMLTPGAKTAPAAEVINCRCAVHYQSNVFGF